MEMVSIIALTLVTAGFAYVTLKMLARPKAALKPVRIDEQRSARRRAR